MSDHPVFVPTSSGPVGGIVTEPDGRLRAAAVILEGVGGRRFGVNRVLTRTAWALAHLGMVVLRVDYPGKGESGMTKPSARTEPILLECMRWFRERTQALPLQLVATCAGTLPAARFAAEEPDLLGLTLISPHLRTPPPEGAFIHARQLAGRTLGRARRPLDRRTRWAVVAVARRAPTVAIVGEADVSLRDTRALRELAWRAGAQIELDVVPGAALHGQTTLRSQEETLERVLRSVSAAMQRQGAVLR